MSRSIFLRRTALLSALTAFAIPEMHAEPAPQANLFHQSERHLVQPIGLGSSSLHGVQLVPTQRWVF